MKARYEKQVAFEVDWLADRIDFDELASIDKWPSNEEEALHKLLSNVMSWRYLITLSKTLPFVDGKKDRLKSRVGVFLKTTEGFIRRFCENHRDMLERSWTIATSAPRTEFLRSRGEDTDRVFDYYSDLALLHCAVAMAVPGRAWSVLPGSVWSYSHSIASTVHERLGAWYFACSWMTDAQKDQLPVPYRWRRSVNSWIELIELYWERHFFPAGWTSATHESEIRFIPGIGKSEARSGIICCVERRRDLAELLKLTLALQSEQPTRAQRVGDAFVVIIVDEWTRPMRDIVRQCLEEKPEIDLFLRVVGTSPAHIQNGRRITDRLEFDL